MKKVIWLVVAVLVVWGIVAATKDSRVKETGPIKVGFIGPLTGDAAPYGEPIHNGIKLAIDEINAKGGVNGNLLELVSEDGKCNGKDAASAAQKLVNVDKVKYIIGGICSGEVFGFAPVTETGKVIVISPSATNPKIAEAGNFVFRNAPNDDLRGSLLAEKSKEAYKKAAIITEKTDYSQGLRTAFQKKAGEIGLEIVADEEFDPGTTDYRSSLSKIKASGADVIFLNPQDGSGLARLASQARQVGITAQFIASEFNGPEVLQIGAPVNGMIVAVAPSLSTEGKAKEFADAYKAKYNKDVDYAYYAAAAYDGVTLIAQAIKEEGNDTEDVKKYLDDINGYDGLIGKYSFDANGDIEGIGFVFQVIKNGKVEPLN